MSDTSPELRFVEFVPEEERHGRPAHQFPLWFSVNMMLLTALTGGIGVLAGLNMVWSIIAIVIGNLVGAFFVAAHAVQGPRLGIPQMIQSRAQFGVYGAVIPLLVVFVMYVGYFASNSVIAGNAIEAGTPLNATWGIVVSGAIVLAITYYGHDAIHTVERWLAVFLACGFVALTVVTFQQGFPSGAWNLHDFSPTSFLLLVAATATWQLTFAPYVADYSRYLPTRTESKPVFLYTYAGLTVSTIWLMTLGAALMTIFSGFGDAPSETIAGLFPAGIAPVIYLFIVLGVIATNVFNLYGAFMSLVTIIDSVTRVPSKLSVRAALLLVVFLISTAVAVSASDDFMAFFGNLLVVLAYLLFPWTAINLVDFYFVRRGEYYVPDIYDPKGRYGTFSSAALLSYALAILVELPFMGTAFFEGPLYTALGGVDIAWIIALVLPGLIYFLLMRTTRLAGRTAGPPMIVEPPATAPG